MLLTPTLDDQDSNGPESDEELETDEEDPDWAPGAEESEDEDLYVGFIDPFQVKWYFYY